MDDGRPAAEVATAAVSALVGRLRDRDATGAVALFCDDGILVRSAAGESASGRAELTACFGEVTGWPFTVGWAWELPVAGRQDDVVWFVCPATLQPRGDGAPADRPYRLSGVLRRTGADWRFALFNGSEPAPG